MYLWENIYWYVQDLRNRLGFRTPEIVIDIALESTFVLRGLIIGISFAILILFFWLIETENRRLASMAPSATESHVSIQKKVGEGASVAKDEKVEHVHGGEDLTPLEAISHGGVVMSGEIW